MSENYSRRTQKSNRKPSQEHIQKGFSALQKTIALIGSILSIIVASITIYKATDHPKNDTKSDNKTATTTVIIEKDKTHTEQSQQTTPSSTKESVIEDKKETTTTDKSETTPSDKETTTATETTETSTEASSTKE